MKCSCFIVVESSEPRLKHISITDDEMRADLVDGRSIRVPPAWSWRLSEATPEQRQNFQIIGEGLGVHWPDIDEDICVQGMLLGHPALKPKHSATG
jgi:hypothetical protein